MTLSKSDILAKKDAAEFRRAQGLSAAEAVNLESLLLQLNVVTVFLPLQGVSGMAVKMTKMDKVNRFILVNAHHSIGRQNFTLCHELYHLFVQKDFTAQVCQTGVFNRKDENEYRADLFASHFLMPEDAIERLLPEDELTHKSEVSLASLLKLEHYFGASRAAIMTRLSSLGYEGFRKTEKLNKLYGKDVQKKAMEYGYDTDIYKVGNLQKVIGDYGVLARGFFENELISESRYAELMQDIFVNIYTSQSDETENT
jgi:Zn-dependent peptidase ImmA (M78 family)